MLEMGATDDDARSSIEDKSALAHSCDLMTMIYDYDLAILYGRPHR